MITTRGLSYRYPTGLEIRFPDLTITKGDKFLLLGESGSGKTTLLHLVGGLIRNYTGSVTVNDTEIQTLRGGNLDRFRGRHIGFIFQRHHLVDAFSVLDNLLVVNYLAGVPLQKSYALELLEELGIAEKAYANVKMLSQGQAQRVAIARALMNKPALVLADEPTSALDNKSSIRVTDLLIQAAERHGATLFIATHDHRLKSEFSKQVTLGVS